MKVLGLLACSRGGLGETELQYLLSDDLSKAVAMMVWAQVRRTLKPFLRNVAGRREEERLDFFHASIQEVSNLISHSIARFRTQSSVFRQYYQILDVDIQIWPVLSDFGH